MQTFSSVIEGGIEATVWTRNWRVYSVVAREGMENCTFFSEVQSERSRLQSKGIGASILVSVNDTLDKYGLRVREYQRHTSKRVR